MIGILLLPLIWYLIFIIVVSEFGADRELGFWKTFFLSIFFSPLFGMLFVLASPNKEISEEVVYDRTVPKYSVTHKIIFGIFIVIVALMFLSIFL